MTYIYCLIALITGCIIGFLVGKLSLSKSNLELIQIREQLKTKDEIEKLKKAAILADKCFEHICNFIKVRND